MNPDRYTNKASSLLDYWGGAGGRRQDYAGRTSHCLTKRGHRMLSGSECWGQPQINSNLAQRRRKHLWEDSGMSAHHVMTINGWALFLRLEINTWGKRKAATAIKYQLKVIKLSVIQDDWEPSFSQLRVKSQIQQPHGSNFNIIQRNIELNINLKL